MGRRTGEKGNGDYTCQTHVAVNALHTRSVLHLTAHPHQQTATASTPTRESWAPLDQIPLAEWRSREQGTPLEPDLPRAAAGTPYSPRRSTSPVGTQVLGRFRIASPVRGALCSLDMGLAPVAPKLTTSRDAWVSSPSSLCRHPRKHGPSSVLSLCGAVATDPRGCGAVPLEQPWRTPKESPRGGGAESSPRQIPAFLRACQARRRRILTVTTRGGDSCPC